MTSYINGHHYELPSGSSLLFNDDVKTVANFLANRFYVCFGYISRPDYDFSSATHPMEQNVFVMALEAISYEAEYGFL